MSIPFKIYLTNLEKSNFRNKDNNYFLFFVRGETKISINRDIHVFHISEFFLTQALDELEVHETNNTLVYVFEINEVSLIPYLTIVDPLYVNSKHMSVSARKIIQTRFSHLVNQYFDKTSNVLLIQSLLLMFLEGIGKQSTMIINETIKESTESERIQHIKRIIHQNLHSRITIEDLASQLFITPQYLSRYIKEKLGVSYLKYISQLRVQLAEKDLIYTNDSLTSIANHRGFANVNALINAFKEIHQLTPREYRMKHKQSKQNDDELFSHTPISDFKIANDQIKEYLGENQSKFIHQSQNKSYIIDANAGLVSEQSNAKTINLGFARNMLSNAFQDQLVKMQSQLTFTYARFQGIFEHGIIDRVPNTSVYNFSKANRIIDFLYEHQLLPFIEMGNKPEKINLSAEQYISLSENNRLYKNSNEWQLLVKSFIKNCINRYGTSEVSKWIFDYWYPHGKALEYSLSYADSYMNNFVVLYDTIKHYLPMARVGGMGLKLNSKRI
jgi:xylan 1,4-beta-xylosidase